MKPPHQAKDPTPEPPPIWIRPDGAIEAIWDDRLADVLRALGQPEIRRASHVEPTPDGRWQADLGPSGGPTLGPFGLRGQALEAERAWLLAQLDRRG